VRKLLLLLSLILLSSVSARGQGTPVIGASCPASGQTGITSAGVSVTCTQSGGVLVWVNLNGGGGSGVSSYTALSNLPMIDPRNSAYAGGAKFNAGTNNAMTTNGTTTLTCSGCLWVTGVVGTSTPPAAVGQTVFLTLSASGNPGGANACLDNASVTIGGAAAGTIASVQSNTSLTLSGITGTSATALVCGAWGTDDTAALNAAWTAGGCIASLQLPVGFSIFSAPIFQNIAGCPAIAGSGTGYQGQRVVGSSVVGTYLIPSANFNFTGCAGALATNGCVGNVNVGDYESFNVWGLGARCAATEANTVLFLVGSATRAVNVNGVGWCGRGGGATLYGFNVAGATDIFTWGGSNYFGSIGINFGGVAQIFGNSFVSGNLFSVNSTPVVAIGNNASVVSTSNSITGAIQLGTSAIFSSVSLYHTCQDASGAGINLATGAKAFFLGNDNLCQNPPSGALGLYFSGTGGFASLKGSTVSGGAGAGIAIDCAGGATNVVNDEGGNTFTAGGGGTLSGCSFPLNTSVAGTTPVTGNFSLTNATFTSATGSDERNFTLILAASAAATVTVVYTFPVSLQVTPGFCTAIQNGGTNPVLNWTSSAMSKTGVTFTSTASATNTDTIQLAVDCR
jgi:hypothetical protein